MRICAWCGAKLGETQAGLVTHGICKRCTKLYFDDDLPGAGSKRRPVSQASIAKAAVRSVENA